MRTTTLVTTLLLGSACLAAGVAPHPQWRNALAPGVSQAPGSLWREMGRPTT
jgi:hypothetical protein